MTMTTLCETIRLACIHVLRACASLTLSLCLILLGAGGISPASAGERPARSGEIKPELLYHNYCSVCHGDRGDGHSRASASLVPPPRDFTTVTNLTRETMIAAVANGKAGTAMIGWKTQLTGKEIEAVVDYIRNGFMQAAIDPLVARGRSVYGHNCATCHGESGKGPLVADAGVSTPPPDLTVQRPRTEINHDRLIASIARGKHGSQTGGFSARLSDQDIAAVAEYLIKVIMTGPIESISGTRARDVQPQAASTAGKSAGKSKTALADMDPPLPNGLSGNPRRGEKYFMVNCSACHGIKGDGQGPRAFFISPKPRNFIEKASAGFNRPMLFASISMGKPGTVMPAWNTVLKDQEIADIAEFVYSTFIRPGAADRAGGK